MPIPPPPVPLVTVMGVSGSGKTTIGAALAQRLRVPFADADDFHTAANIAKMSAGVPLDDLDRLPWLHAIGLWLADHAAGGAVVSASALKRSYRDILRETAPTQFFVHLDGSPDVIARRVAGRPGHFSRQAWSRRSSPPSRRSALTRPVSCSIWACPSTSSSPARTPRSLRPTAVWI